MSIVFLFFLQLGTPACDSLVDDRKGGGTTAAGGNKHVSFDSSSLLRSQTVTTMDEVSFVRSHFQNQQHQMVSTGMQAAESTNSCFVQAASSNSNERLIEASSGRKTPDFEYYSQVFPPEIARQLMIGRSLLWDNSIKALRLLLLLVAGQRIYEPRWE